MRIQVPAGRQLQFFDQDGKVLPVPAALQLTREIDLPDAASSVVPEETSGRVVANRVGVTGALFGIAIGAAYFLGRPRG